MSWAIIGVAVFLALPAYGQAQPAPADKFAVVNGVKLHFVDWGGTGEPLLFLTGGGGSAHQFDAVAQKFTDRFRVLGLTRRGQRPSDIPASGYDTTTLALDIKAFLDFAQIGRVTLVGYSIAGDEQTKFAVLYPGMVNKLVYLDAAFDRASGKKLSDKLQPVFQLPVRGFDHPLSALIDGAEAADPDYASVRAPALAFYVVYDQPRGITPDMDASTKAKMETLWNDHVAPFAAQQRDRFRREMQHGRIVELRNTDHQSILNERRVVAEIVSEMRLFLGAE
jgi:pimeloyl-ACP methyl ester carboxylesterase